MRAEKEKKRADKLVKKVFGLPSPPLCRTSYSSLAYVSPFFPHLYAHKYPGSSSPISYRNTALPLMANTLRAIVCAGAQGGQERSQKSEKGEKGTKKEAQGAAAPP